MSGWAFHGGRLAEAKAHFGEGRAPWIDLSTGINPHGWPGAAGVAIDWRALPGEGALAALEAAAAACFGVDPGHVCAVPGTEIGLRMLGGLLPGPAAFVIPCYRTHGEMFAASRPIADMAAAETGETLILANPNNPDGRIVPPARLEALLAGTGGRWLVIDEAFADAVPAISRAGAVGEDVPLIVFRSFGKFFGLAGVRLGFVIAPRAIVARYRAKMGGWPVSAAAIAIGTAAYRDTGWIAAMRGALRDEAAALDAVLARHGHRAIGQCPLFRLIETEGAAALFARLAAHAILTRPFDDDPRRLRIGLPGDAAALARLDAALADG